MPRHEKIVCACGGELSRPLPKACPHCGAIIAGERRAVWPLVWRVLFVLGLFGLLAGFVLFLLG